MVLVAIPGAGPEDGTVLGRRLGQSEVPRTRPGPRRRGPTRVTEGGRPALLCGKVGPSGPAGSELRRHPLGGFDHPPNKM